LVKIPEEALRIDLRMRCERTLVQRGCEEEIFLGECVPKRGYWVDEFCGRAKWLLVNGVKETKRREEAKRARRERGGVSWPEKKGKKGPRFSNGETPKDPATLARLRGKHPVIKGRASQSPKGGKGVKKGRGMYELFAEAAKKRN